MIDGPRLGLDTTTPFLSTALWWPSDGRVERSHARLDRRLAADLVPSLDAFLRAHGVAASDLRGVGVGVGPGSFTGARIGVAWALAVGRALSLRVVGGDSLAARAWAATPVDGCCLVATAASRGHAWCQPWRREGHDLVPLAPRTLSATSDLPADAAASLDLAPDASWHARLVDRPGSPAPLVSYDAGRIDRSAP